MCVFAQRSPVELWPSDADSQTPKGGGGSRWQTPHYKAIMAGKVEMGTAMDVGDEGIWVTYARGMKAKAVREFKELCELVSRALRCETVVSERVSPGGKV